MGTRLDLAFNIMRQAGGSISVYELAVKLGVSQRTVYNDIRRINEQLVASGVSAIEIDRGNLSVDVDASVDYERVLSPLATVYSDPEMRRGRILLYLGSQEGRISLVDIADHFAIARNTAGRDIRALESPLAKYSLTIQGQSYQGYELVGRERDIRRALVDYASEDPFFIDHGFIDDGHEVQEGLVFFIRAVSQDTGVTFSDASVRRLLVVLLVMRVRLRMGKTLDPRDFAELSMLEVTREGRAASSRRSLIESVFGCRVGDAELVAMAEAFESCSVVKYEDLLSEMWVTFSVLAERIIGLVGEKYPLYRFSDDKDLYEGVLNHLRPAYRRAVTGAAIPNPMFHLVTERYPELHRAVMDALSEVAPILGASFTEEEVAYFTLFFAASAERSGKLRHRSVRAIVVCSAGMSTSQMLKARVESRFDIEVVRAFGVAEATAWLRDHDIDVVIATVPFESAGHEVLVVDPLLTSGDEGRISKIAGPARPSADVGKILGLVRKRVSLDYGEMKLLERDLESLFGAPQKDTLGIPVRPITLRDALSADAVEVDFMAVDRDEAVGEAGRLLVATGRASAGYMDAMVSNARSNGTYIVVSPGIAFPHARSEDGALNIGFSVIVLSKPVNFGHPSNDPVRVVVGMCAVDRQSHLQALGELVEILNDPRRVDSIVHATSRKEVMRALGLV